MINMGSHAAWMSHRLVRPGTETFSISFRDCITCALGLVVLLLVISNIRTPEMQQQDEDIEMQIAKVASQTGIMNRDLAARKEQLLDEKARIAWPQGDLNDVHGQIRASKQAAGVVNQLSAAQQTVTQAMKRPVVLGFQRKEAGAIGGIPDDSEYVIFVIDTSGSMFNYVWPLLLQKVEETFNLYPKLRGFQLMNDEGTYMFATDRGKWIPDTPEQRKIVLDRLRTWNAFSNSNPIEGILEAIHTYYAKDKKISIYVFGDEFTGPSIDSVVKSVDLLNREGETGDRRVRIHAVAFPVRPDAPEYTSTRFVMLMRILCQRNGGSFVELDDPEHRPPAVPEHR